MTRGSKLLMTAILACPIALVAASVSVTGVTVTGGPVCSTGSASLTVSATVTPTYDAGSVSGPSVSKNNCGSTGGYCGTGDPTVACKRTSITTTVTVSNK